MKKWLYVLVPTVMLGLFLILYLSEVKKMDEKEQQNIAAQAKLKQEDDARKARLQEQAAADQKKKAEERQAEQERKEKERAAKLKAEDDKIHDEMVKAKAEADAHSKKIAELQKQLDDLHAQREKANGELLDTLKAVERAKIDRETAELNEQRLTDMIAKRAADSSLVRMPAPVMAAPPR